jgi:zinc and cadmium transporter
MTPAALLIIYCVLILLASLAGGWLPLWVRLTHTRMQLATSFVSGLMLGVGLLHLLPHAFHETESIDLCALWLLAGFLAMFLIQRFFHFHHHDVPAEAPEDHAGCCPEERRGLAALEPHDHDHFTLADQSARHLSWIGAALGLAFHTLINGIALGASVEAEAQAGTGMLLGLGTFLVIFLHKPFDALGERGLRAGDTARRRVVSPRREPVHGSGAGVPRERTGFRGGHICLHRSERFVAGIAVPRA